MFTLPLAHIDLEPNREIKATYFFVKWYLTNEQQDTKVYAIKNVSNT